MKITIEQYKGNYRLRWNNGAGRQSLPLKLSITPTNKAYASKLKSQMEFDYHTRQWDGSKESAVERYLPSRLGKASPETTVQLFDRFTAHKRKIKDLAESGVKSRYLPISKYLTKHLDKPAAAVTPQEAERFAEVLAAAKISPQTIKERLWLLESCWAYAELPNVWKGLTERFRPTPRQPVEPFTLDELRLIVKTFYDHPHYSHYADYVRLQCNYPMRPGEASGLLWKNVTENFTKVWIVESVTRGVRRSTKTGKGRAIPLSPEITAMLRDRHAKFKPKPNDLVFPSPQGKPIDDNNFRNRVWKPVLKLAGVDYRRQYATRHSVISHGLHMQSSAIAIAEVAGHGKQVLLKTYAHAIGKDQLFPIL